MDPKDDLAYQDNSNSYVDFLRKQKEKYKERQETKNETRMVKFEDREERSDLKEEDIKNQAKGRYYSNWKGVFVLKNPVDSAIKQQMLQEIKPATIFEIGTFNGGSALWMADIMKIHDVKSHVYAMDIDLSYLDPKVKEREDITVIKGDVHKIEEAFPEDMLKSLPHPWLVNEDAHLNLPNLLEYFDRFMVAGDYFAVEDTHPSMFRHNGYGLIEGVEYVACGKKWALEPFKEFMKKHGSKYRVDTGYTDLYGYNTTWNYNSIICKV